MKTSFFKKCYLFAKYGLILLKLSPEVTFLRRKKFIAYCEKIEFLGKSGGPKVCTFGSTLTPHPPPSLSPEDKIA